jgi:ABC-type enterochelin transport system substrate-binding protein
LTSVSGSNTVYSRATGSFTSLFVKYAASSGSNSRAGETIVAWNANNVAITDYSTVDLGNTVGLRHTASVAAGTLTYSANTTTAGWTIKSLVTFI